MLNHLMLRVDPANDEFTADPKTEPVSESGPDQGFIDEPAFVYSIDQGKPRLHLNQSLFYKVLFTLYVLMH
jgi:hypothetical protein